ncbi:MAG: hypothetical protein ABSH34_13280 [Verrucomicrobiota bacterium]|jgi:hypothetical protein
MPTEVAKPKVTPTQILEDMARLTARQLETVIERAAVLRLQKRGRVMSSRESDLLRDANGGLSPEKNARLARLEHKLCQETLTRHEHQQLLRLTGELERLGAQRLKALIELAAMG